MKTRKINQNDHSTQRNNAESARSEGRTRREPRSGGGGGTVWLYGTHAVLAALANPERRVRRLVATAEAARGLPAGGAPVETLARPEIDRLLPAGAVHQGIAAQVEPLPGWGIEDIGRAAGASAVVVVLDQVTDPHNVGAILRSAAAFGALAVVVPDRHAPEETGTLAKSASGALERMPLVRVTNLARALEILKADGFWIAGLAADGPVTLAGAKLTGKIALVLGAEGEGLRRLTRTHCDHLVRLPISGAVESLNVSNAAAIALYELARDAG
jgi:23S rRNA (guanosine2251-2'-O)-methyltransferase